MTDPPLTDRDRLAERRLLRVLRSQVNANARTLEQKIADAGPSNMRVDPRVLTAARRRLEKAGTIRVKREGSMRWYCLAESSAKDVESRYLELSPLHAATQDTDFLKRLGQTLEIAVYRALIVNPNLTTMGGFPDLHTHDDSTLYIRHDPPAGLSGRYHSGRLDFIVATHTGALAGVEVKNVREWLYPDRDEVRDLLSKCTTLNVVPVLIARRIPFVTFKVLTACGVIIHQTYNQLFPSADAELAARVRDKNLLGYHDVRTGNAPDVRLLKFANVNLAALIESRRRILDEFRDRLGAYGEKTMDYGEFAARVRRRVAGTNEDNDWLT